jgi:TolB-like protein
VGSRHAGEEVTASEKSIAVLPFLSLSSGEDDEYFADGLTEEILNSLAQLPELLVTARTSSFYFKGREVPVQEIAAKLGVGTIVEGSVRRAGERLRVTAQLIRAADGFHLWSENYDSTSEDTIAVQEDIAEKIASAMNVVLDDQKREAMRLAGLRNVAAFVAMQKGVQQWEVAHNGRDIVEKLGEANRYFEQVLELVPDYALAYQYHSDAYIHRLIDGANGWPDGVADPAGVEEAMTAALADYEQVLRFARTPQERNNAELDLAYITGEWRGMPARIERFAAEQGCSQPSWIENVALPFGYSHLSKLRAREFTVCDPMSSSTWRSDVRTRLWDGDPAAALESAQKGSDLAPGDWLRFQLVSALVAMKRFEEAESEISARFQDEMISLSGRMMIAAARGDREQVGLFFEQFGRSPDADDFWELNYAAWAGERDRANTVAARIDKHAFGSQALTTVLIWCLCGPAFDLDATPNFAADIRESGLVWPPVSPIRFPLKNW